MIDQLIKDIDFFLSDDFEYSDSLLKNSTVINMEKSISFYKTQFMEKGLLNNNFINIDKLIHDKKILYSFIQNKAVLQNEEIPQLEKEKIILSFFN